MTTLYVLYDNTWPDHLRLRDWLVEQPALVPLHWHPHKSEEVSHRFPGLTAHLTPRELTVVSDDGRLWVGPAAAVMCLYALEDHREFAVRLAHPALLTYARTALELMSRNVGEMTRLLEDSPHGELEGVLRRNAEVLQQRYRVPPPPPPLPIKTPV